MLIPPMPQSMIPSLLVMVKPSPVASAPNSDYG
jgi:hypothetical protein